MMSQKVLIIDPDPATFGALKTPLEQAGFQPLQADDGSEGLGLIETEKPAIIILEIDTQNYLAFDFCRKLRFHHGNWTPLILISQTDKELDLVLGLELGADDYVRKPIRAKELIARMKSIVRREKIGQSSMLNKEQLSDSGIISIGELVIDPNRFSVYVKKKSVDLTKVEFQILYHFCCNLGRPISRDELLSIVRDDEKYHDVRIIDIYISKLREKIEADRRNPSYIKTVRNIGYLFQEIKIPV
ncbi:response regulator transcription factor [Bacillaceae bacterium IKA-2]|nr:response regulator transcription factor [Bacillaceae bacterium IKA-2]